MNIRLLFLFAASVIAQVQSPVPTPATPDPVTADRGPFVLGVLRRDGVVSPFAAFDGSRWKAPWPVSLQYVELPISIEGIPKSWWGKAGAPRSMTVWADGAKRGTVELTRPTTLPIMCAPRIALVSTYKSPEPAPPPIVQPYPKDGLVVSGERRVEPIETIYRTSPEWGQTAVMLLEPFDAAELKAIYAFPQWKHPIATAKRRLVPLELETLYKAPMDEAGWTAYHFEAVKRYAPGPDDDGCGLVTSASGWILKGPGDRQRTPMNAIVTYCDRKDDTFMLPLGLINAAGRAYWVYQLSGYEQEGYVVARPTRDLVEAVIQYPVGSCER